MGKLLVLSLLIAIAAMPVMATPINLQIQTTGSAATYSGTGPAADITGTYWNGVLDSTVKDSAGNALPGVTIKTGCWLAGGPPAGYPAWMFGIGNMTESTFATDSYEGMSALYNTDLLRHIAYRPDDIGIAVSGLPAGTYNVYSMNSMINYPSTQSIDIGLNLAGPVPGGLAESYTWGDVSLTDWTAGKNYVVATVTVTGPSDWVTVITQSDPAGGYVSSNGIQIVQVVPEPATMSLLALGGLAMLRRRK